MKTPKLLAGMMALSVMAGALVPSAFADHRDYRDYRDNYRGYSNSGGFLRGHPYVRKALIGGGVGAVIGGLAARDGERVSTAVKGGLIGGAIGTGYEYLKRKGI